MLTTTMFLLQTGLTVITLTALCIFVFPLQLGGCGILGVGVWLSVTQGNFATLSSSLPSLSAANLLIAVGTIIMVIGCLGCVGAVKESRPLLLTVRFFPESFLMLSLTLTQGCVGVMMPRPYTHINFFFFGLVFGRESTTY